MQNRTTASRQMQQPAGVDEMSTVYLENPIWSSFCEKNPLFRHGVLLPKIEYAPIIRPRMYQSIALLAIPADQVQRKTDITYPVLLAPLCKIITSTQLKRHSSQHAA